MKDTAFKVARNVAWLGTGEIALKGALFAAGVVVARGLGPAGMGAFTVAYGAALVLMQVLAGGQVEVLIRETARYQEAGRAFYALALAHQRRLAAIVLPVAAVGAALVPDPVLRWTLLGFIPYAYLRRWLITIGAVFKGLDRMDVEVRGRALELLVAVPCLAVASGLHAPVWTTGPAFGLGGVAGLAWILAQLRRLPAGTAAPLSRAALAREGMPFLGIAIVNQLLTRSDSFLLAGLGVPRAEIGRYGVASAPVQGLNAASQVFAVATYPTLARWAAAGRLRPRLVLLFTAGGLALGSLLGTLLYVFREVIVRVFFGPQFASSAALLAVLAWALPALCAGMLAGAVLAATRRQRWPLASQSVVLAVSVVANLLVIPRWGTAGCAAVTVAGVYVSALVHTTLAVIAVSRGPQPGEVEPVFLPLGEGEA